MKRLPVLVFIDTAADANQRCSHNERMGLALLQIGNQGYSSHLTIFGEDTAQSLVNNQRIDSEQRCSVAYHE
ncbi:hypothetical protein OIU84_018237 [Salix udensis]|uniref:Uncharacterized protein n=1 Tax=Salix udensis TaxID=889485 RepID=A0AAD6J687_9ROSI|nr:hypothetical protein OIU84_018237 [Salix udensis]